MTQKIAEDRIQLNNATLRHVTEQEHENRRLKLVELVDRYHEKRVDIDGYIYSINITDDTAFVRPVNEDVEPSDTADEGACDLEDWLRLQLWNNALVDFIVEGVEE